MSQKFVHIAAKGESYKYRTESQTVCLVERSIFFLRLFLLRFAFPPYPACEKRKKKESY